MVDPHQRLEMFISFPSFMEIRAPEGGLPKIGTKILPVFWFNYARVATKCDTISEFVSLHFSQVLWPFIFLSAESLGTCHISDRSTMDQRCIVGTSIAFICSSWSGGQTKESGLGREKERPIASISRIGQKLPCTHSVRSWLRKKAEKYDGDLVIRKKRWVFGQTHKIWDLVKKPPWVHSIRSRLWEKNGVGIFGKFGDLKKTVNLGQKHVGTSCTNYVARTQSASHWETRPTNRAGIFSRFTWVLVPVFFWPSRVFCFLVRFYCSNLLRSVWCIDFEMRLALPDKVAPPPWYSWITANPKRYLLFEFE